MAQGDAAVQRDCNVRDPPEMILTCLEKWCEGHNVVVGIRAFYRLIKRISYDAMIETAEDFRRVDRSVMERRLNGGFLVLSPKMRDLFGSQDTISGHAPMRTLVEAGELVAYTRQGFWQPKDTIECMPESLRRDRISRSIGTYPMVSCACRWKMRART